MHNPCEGVVEGYGTSRHVITSMNEEDFACSSFAPQRWRKDVCRKCYQPLRLHEKKKDRLASVTMPPQTTSSATTSNVKLPVSRSKDTKVKDEFRDKPDPPQTNRLSGPPPQEATQPTSQKSSTGPSSPALISKDQSKHTEQLKGMCLLTECKLM